MLKNQVRTWPTSLDTVRDGNRRSGAKQTNCRNISDAKISAFRLFAEMLFLDKLQSIVLLIKKILGQT